MSTSVAGNTRPAKPEWYLRTAAYAKSDPRRAVAQMANSILPYLVLLALMYETIRRGLPYWTTLALALVAAGFFTRIFIFFHDCTHGSFLPSPALNRVAGYIFGIMTFTPFDDWRRTHAGHHMTAGDLDRRGTGDIWLLTVEEYRAAGFFKRLGYRLYRSPLIMFGVGPGWVFLLRNRVPFKGWKKRDLISVLVTNAALLGIALVASLTIGFRAYVAIQLPVLLIAATLGVWLFYIQHNFQGVYWARHDELDPMKVALEGASHYRLPKMLQWFTGNIGLHHLHHVRPGIPNYHLQACLDATPEAHIPPVTIRTSLHSLRLKLLDEERGLMVGFSAAGAAVLQAQPLGILRGFFDDMWKVFLLHGVVAHVHNGLIPVSGFLLLLALISESAYLDRTVLHLLLVALAMIPVSFVSGIRDWRKKFHGGRAPVFYTKMWLTGALFILIAGAVAIRLGLGTLQHPEIFRWIYAGCIFTSIPVVVMLGHYGAKLASTRK